MHTNILSTVGRTPVVRLSRMAPNGVEIYVKLESFNPSSSIKDRIALNTIEKAEQQGRLKSGQTVIEATSGNTGISLAMVCAAKGYPLVVVMAENFSVERRKLMRFMGARVVLTPASHKGSGMYAKARELAQAHGWFLVDQFANPDTVEAHEKWTAREILQDFAQTPLSHLVLGAGTGGTVLGVAKVLRKESPETKIVVCEPANSPVLRSGAKPDGSESLESHPEFRPHPMQGWTPDFLPVFTESAQSTGLIDEIRAVEGVDAVNGAIELARREGILTGITGGASVAGALAIAKEAKRGRILVVLPDTGERYLSTVLFDGIQPSMNDEEWEISRSTPNVRFDTVAPAAATTNVQPRSPMVSPKAIEFVEQTINNANEPIVMFALQWCEFCWALRRFFEALGVRYKSVDLDSSELQRDGFGTEVRDAVRKKTEQPTIPQVFVGGMHIGGCMDTLERWRSGSLQALLLEHGAQFKQDVSRDVSSFLPTWLQPVSGH